MRYTIADNSSLSRFVRSVRRFPGDVVVALGFVVAADVALLSLRPEQTALRAFFALPLLLFVPGYGLVSALFPGRAPDGEWRSAARPAGAADVTVGERLALAVGASVALLLPLGIVVSVLGLGYGTPAVLGVVSAVAVVTLLVGAVRRLQLPESERFQVPIRQWTAELHAGTVGADSRLDAVLNVALAAAVLLAATGVTYALVAPPRDQPHTNFSLYTETDSGDLVTSGYPSELVRGESESLTVGIQNREGRDVQYTVVVELQRVRTDGGSVSVLERQPVTRMQPTVGAGETWRQRHAVTPELRGSNLRLTYYLYEGDAPATPSAASADQTLFTWVNVTGQ